MSRGSRFRVGRRPVGPYDASRRITRIPLGSAGGQVPSGLHGDQSGRQPSIDRLPQPLEPTIDNPILAAIQARRSTYTFSSEPVADQQLEDILDAGRWAPSGLNSQPWDFIVVKDPQVRAEVADILKRVTIAWEGFASAPLMIVVAVDPSRDPEHFIEDGAAAVQNLCLASHSLGLASSWAGVYAKRTTRGSVESALKRLLSLPPAHRIIAVVPVGHANGHTPRSSRIPLKEMVHLDRFHPGQRYRS